MRYMPGETILSNKEIEWAYEKWCDGYTQFEIADALHVGAKTIYRALRGKPRIKPVLEYGKSTNEKLEEAYQQGKLDKSAEIAEKYILNTQTEIDSMIKQSRAEAVGEVLLLIRRSHMTIEEIVKEVLDERLDK